MSLDKKSTPFYNFAGLMASRLVENEHKDEIGWKDLSNVFLLNKIHFHVRLVGLHLRLFEEDKESAIDHRKTIKEEAADLANYCMMLVDNLDNEKEESND